MKKLILLLTLILSACGASPGQANDELEYLQEHPEEWCGTDVHEVENVDKSIVPDGYGHLSNRYGCPASGAWPGGHCWVPEYTSVRWRNNLNSGNSAWNLSQTGALNEVESRLDGLGWNITQTSVDYVYEFSVNNTLVTPGATAEADFNDVYYTTTTLQGDIRSFVTCVVTVYRGRVMLQDAWQGADAAHRDTYVKYLFDHEGMHCAGLPHVTASQQLMSASHGTWAYNQDYDPSQAELDDLEDWAN